MIFRPDKDIAIHGAKLYEYLMVGVRFECRCMYMLHSHIQENVLKPGETAVICTASARVEIKCFGTLS